ncbi:MAG: ABC transporter, partial [Oscillospiraceae bacterium]|nr:ABC transporter [Oscillospiraceae bacterium]
NEEIKRRQHIKDLESRIAEIEEQIQQLEQEISLPEIYENYVLMGEKCNELDQAKQTLALVMEEWVQCSE